MWHDFVGVLVVIKLCSLNGSLITFGYNMDIMWKDFIHKLIFVSKWWSNPSLHLFKSIIGCVCVWSNLLTILITFSKIKWMSYLWMWHYFQVLQAKCTHSNFNVASAKNHKKYCWCKNHAEHVLEWSCHFKLGGTNTITKLLKTSYAKTLGAQMSENVKKEKKNICDSVSIIFKWNLTCKRTRYPYFSKVTCQILHS